MFRKMKQLDKDIELKVIEHIMLRNFWEIYVLEPSDIETNPLDEGELLTLTVGDFTEMGMQWEAEIKPHIITRTKNLHEVAPAPNWQWVGE